MCFAELWYLQHIKILLVTIIAQKIHLQSYRDYRGPIAFCVKYLILSNLF